MELLWKAIAKDAYGLKPNDKMWEEQCFTNFPILYLSSIYLHDHAQKHGCKTFLFATRDCCHWYKVFKALYPTSDAHYFHCSRNMFETAENNQAFKEYVRSMVTNVDQTIFIDIHGTGRRAIRYFEKEFGKSPYCLLLSATYKNYRQFPTETYKQYQKGRFVNLVFDARGSPIEMLNYDLVGTLQNYLPVTGPVRDKPEYDLSKIRPYHDCMSALVSRIKPIKGKREIAGNQLLDEINRAYRPILEKKPAISRWIDHLGNHDKNPGAEVNILNKINFEEILSRDTVHGLIWSGLYNDHPCVVKMIKLTSGELQTKKKNEKVPYHHQELVSKKPMTPQDFKKEVEALTSLSKHNLVPQVYGFSIENKKFDVHYGFIVIERVDCSVKDILVERRLDPEEIKIVEGVINQMHKVATHGDLKPSNIGVNLGEDGKIKKCLILDCQKVKSGRDHRRSESDWDTFFKHVKENASKRRSITHS